MEERPFEGSVPAPKKELAVRPCALSGAEAPSLFIASRRGAKAPLFHDMPTGTYEFKYSNTLRIPSPNSPSAVIKLNTKYPSSGKS